MRVALISEFSQASKNALILRALENSAEKYDVKWFNTGMKSDIDRPLLSYIHLGIQAFVLLNTGTVDFVVTGCCSGQGACMSLNSYPGVNCGYIADATDAFLFTQINNGNAIALPLAKDFGWAAELKLGDIFEKVFSCERGKGYPPQMQQSQQLNAKKFNEVKCSICNAPIEILEHLEPEIVAAALGGNEFRKCFWEFAKPCGPTRYVETLLEGTLALEAAL